MSDADRVLTWATLLSKWTEFAQAAVALPREGEGGRWRDAVPAIITLQAVTHALGELDELDPAERPVAIDRAEIACRESVARLNALWHAESLPEEVGAIIVDSRVAFEMAANAGVEWRVASDRLETPHPADLCEKLNALGFAGDLFLPAPGVPLFKGSVAAFARGPGGSPPTEDEARAIESFLTRRGGRVSDPERIGTPRQVYRQLDFATGKVTRDLVIPMNEDLPPGQPLLVLAIEGGRACAVPPGAPAGAPIDDVRVELHSPEGTAG
ncbi:MAG: hypothetical protein ACIARR_13595 [Phycisphaerales bacterium JB059]